MWAGQWLGKGMSAGLSPAAMEGEENAIDHNIQARPLLRTVEDMHLRTTKRCSGQCTLGLSHLRWCIDDGVLKSNLPQTMCFACRG